MGPVDLFRELRRVSAMLLTDAEMRCDRHKSMGPVDLSRKLRRVSAMLLTRC